MLGSGLGTAAGLITSGAIGRALETQKAKKDLKEECESQPGMKLKDGKCVEKTDDEKAKEVEKEQKAQDKQEDCETTRGGKLNAGACYCNKVIMLKNDKCANGHIVGRVCTAEYNKAHPTEKVASAVYDETGNCVITKSAQKIKDNIDQKKAICEAPDSNGTWKNGACYCETKPYTKYSNGKCHQ
jgi:hypothetical protein